MADFRFENLEVWKMATEIGHRLITLSETIAQKGDGMFADRFREVSVKVSGILAEGSSCAEKVDFAVHVARARGAVLEIANLVIFCGERELITEEQEDEIVNMLKRESKMLDNFRQSLERAVVEQDQETEEVVAVAPFGG